MLKIVAMPQTNVAAHEMGLRPGPRLMRATIRFAASVGALIGVSLLLAWL
jgi:hypothetical protein